VDSTSEGDKENERPKRERRGKSFGLGRVGGSGKTVMATEVDEMEGIDECMFLL
jgi:hypothetical protein